MASLFKITEELINFRFEIDEETGEILNAKELDDLKIARDEKIENIGLWIKNIEADAEAVKNEKNNMADRQKRLENKAKSLRDYLSYALGGEKFSTPKIAMSYRKSESVNIKDNFVYNDDWCEQKIEWKPDKKRIKDAIKAGTEIVGAELVEKQNLQIK